MLASTSKGAGVMAIMALDEDESVDFSISEPVSTYLPFDGVYADRTVEQMVSNTSGIPGLRLRWVRLSDRANACKISITSANSVHSLS